MADNENPTGLSPKDAIGGLKLKSAPKVRKVNKKGLLVAGSVISIALILSTMWSGPDVSAAAQKKAEDDKKAAMNKPVELSGDTAWYEKASLNSEKNDADSSAKTTEQPATKTDTKKGVPNLTGLGVAPMEAATAPTVGAADLSKEDQQTQKAERQQQQQIMQKKMQDLAQAQRAGLSAQGFSQPNTFQQPQNPNAQLLGQLASYGGAGAQPAAQQQPELDDQNKQDRKDKFLKNQQSDAAVDMDYSSSKLTKPKSPYEVKAGTIVPSVMISGLNSDLPGQVIAQVKENVYDTKSGKYLLIPQGSRLVGLYDNHVAYGQQRILLAWNRVIYPNGNSFDLKGMPGADTSGFAGFFDEVDNHYLKIFGSAAMMSMISAGVQLSQPSSNSSSYNAPTVGQTVGAALGQQIGQTAMTMTQKNLNIQPTLIINPGYEFNVMVTADMILPPDGEENDNNSNN